jgi:hypothetical protein
MLLQASNRVQTDSSHVFLVLQLHFSRLMDSCLLHRVSASTRVSPFSRLGGSKRVFNLCGFLPRLLFFHFFPCTALILWRYAFLCSANRSSVLRNSVLFLLRSLTASLFRRKRISSHPSPPRLTTWKQSRMAIAFGNASLAMARMQSERHIPQAQTSR